MNSILFNTILTNGTVTAGSFLAATLCSVALGLLLALLFRQKKGFSQSYLTTLVILPAAVQMIIMLVNGNIGAGVATAGAFSLVRFRSAPGSSQEITGIFITMAVGIATGMGYLGIAALFAAGMGLLFLALSKIGFGSDGDERILKITIPETLDYDGVFDEVFDRYTKKYELEEVRTTDMGSLYKLTYKLKMKHESAVKAMIDELRVRNGNLEISCGRPVLKADDL
ncbi:MAG: DUF4956 domain-containing protein [Mogibacterium sp.]|nr:DUF4956 domain-containing protein [Mogibacterium sp.]